MKYKVGLKYVFRMDPTTGVLYSLSRWEKIQDWFRRKFRRPVHTSMVVSYDKVNKTVTFDSLP